VWYNAAPIAPMLDGNPEVGVRSVQRALAVLAQFDDHRARWSVSDLARAVGLPKTTTLRLVKTLEQSGLIWSDVDGQVSIGPGLLRWSRLAADVWQLPQPARQVMRELAAQFGETVNLYVRQSLSRVCVAREEGTQAVRHVVQVGDSFPLWAGASAYVLLIDADRELVAAVARSSPKGQRFASTLMQRAQRAAGRGWAQSHGERESGASGVAAPVFDRPARVLAALAVGGPTSRFTRERVDALAPAVRDAAAQMSALHIHWPRSAPA